MLKRTHEADLFATPATVEALRQAESEAVKYERESAASSRERLADQLEGTADSYSKQKDVLEWERRRMLQLEELTG